MIDASGAHIVTDNFFGTNEIRFDPNEEWLYVVEIARAPASAACVCSRTCRLRIAWCRPDDLGGRPDGMTFDAYGNLWITLVSHDRLVALTPEGDVL